MVVLAPVPILSRRMSEQLAQPIGAPVPPPGPARQRSRRAAHRVSRGGLLAGGTEGNERLTVQTGAVLFVLLAAIGVTIVRIGQLTWLHLFLGLLLIGPIALKLASTGYRFARYYTHDRAYRQKGPPLLPLRLLGPVVALSTIAVLATGIVLLAEGPSARQPWMLLHKVGFFVWIAATALHVLGHLPDMRRGLIADRHEREQILAAAGAPGGRPTRSSRLSLGGYGLAARRAGGSARALALLAALAAGLLLAVALDGSFGEWVHYRHLVHHDQVGWR
jgi:hypothetical protein